MKGRKVEMKQQEVFNEHKQPSELEKVKKKKHYKDTASKIFNKVVKVVWFSLALLYCFRLAILSFTPYNDLIHNPYYIFNLMFMAFICLIGVETFLTSRRAKSITMFFVTLSFCLPLINLGSSEQTYSDLLTSSYKVKDITEEDFNSLSKKKVTITDLYITFNIDDESSSVTAFNEDKQLGVIDYVSEEKEDYLNDKKKIALLQWDFTPLTNQEKKQTLVDFMTESVEETSLQKVNKKGLTVYAKDVETNFALYRKFLYEDLKIHVFVKNGEEITLQTFDKVKDWKQISLLDVKNNNVNIELK